GANLTYTWTTADGSILSGADTPLLEIDGPGTYNLLVYNTDNDCFDEEATLVVQNLDVPVVDAGPDGAITCTVTSVDLQGSANGATQNFTYEWTTTDGNIASGNNTLSPTVDFEGTYVLTVTDTVNQCTATSTVDIIQDADVPITSIISSNPFDCNFSEVTLDATGSSTGPNLEYTWSTSDGNIVTFPDPLTAIVDQPGSYTLFINDTVSFCMSTSTFQVMPDTISPSLSIVQPEVLTCEITEVVLDAAAGGLPDISINWNTANGNIVSDEDTFNPTVNQAGTYTLSITNNENGCASTTDVNVTADVALPIVDAGATAIVDCNNPEITLNGTADAGG
ncbi:MAG: hypothetical protein KDC44_21960, partial [Phaeodactylibacter sp.]|nr:hypothetical protein [Phaeodactylibacter sp.]